MKLDQATLDALRTVRVDGNKTTMPQLDRALYAKVNKALECLGGKWSRKERAHVWDCDPGDPLADAVLTGEVRDWKKELQFFPTPAELASQMASLARLDPDHRILEPSAGEGSLLRAIQDHIDSKLDTVVAVEINVIMAMNLRAGFPHSTIHTADFLSLNGELGEFDRVIMNPPFTRGQDIAHVRHAAMMLKPNGGRLVAITSPGWTFRTDAKHTAFRQWMEDSNTTRHDLPAGTFKESGTKIRSVLITFDRP